MLAWVVIDRMYSRQFLPKSSSLRTLCLCIEFSDSLRPTSVVSNHLRTTPRNGRPSTPLQSVRYALFLSRRRCIPPVALALTTAILSNAYPCSLYLYFSISCALFALFALPKKLNAFIFKRFRTLRQKTQSPGGGERGTSAIHQVLAVFLPISARPKWPTLSRLRGTPVTSHQSPITSSRSPSICTRLQEC